ncbi:hypothetical protein LN893_20270 [Pontibacter sp. XAAS-A31]|nr:hypothetical protein [Pontibacter harenae]
MLLPLYNIIKRNITFITLSIATLSKSGISEIVNMSAQLRQYFQIVMPDIEILIDVVTERFIGIVQVALQPAESKAEGNLKRI